MQQCKNARGLQNINHGSVTLPEWNIACTARAAQKLISISISIRITSIRMIRVVSHVKSDASLMREAKAVTSSCPLPRDNPVSRFKPRDALKAFQTQNVLLGISLGPYHINWIYRRLPMFKYDILNTHITFKAQEPSWPPRPRL